MLQNIGMRKLDCFVRRLLMLVPMLKPFLVNSTPKKDFDRKGDFLFEPFRFERIFAQQHSKSSPKTDFDRKGEISVETCSVHSTPPYRFRQEM